MKFRRKGGNPYPDSEPVEVTVKKDGRYWKMSVVYKVYLPEQVDDGKEIGIDLNTYNISYSSNDGEQGMLPLPDLTDKEIKIRRWQRKLARQQKGSGRSKRTKKRIAKWKRKQKNCRTNVAHQHSRRLSNKAHTLKREDLKIKNMSSSSKGTVENLGKNVRAKAGLNRVIQNAGWSRFNTYCDYKFGNVIPVDPKYTSQRCNQCGHVNKDNRTRQSKFKCMACGHAEHADINASANIVQASWIGASAHGGAFPSGTPMSREMDTQKVAA
ncbi:MAG: transposase [Bacteroidetes bacterium]|nr:transposase [Bacteroidota bacterium]